MYKEYIFQYTEKILNAYAYLSIHFLRFKSIWIQKYDKTRKEIISVYLNKRVSLPKLPKQSQCIQQTAIIHKTVLLKLFFLSQV